MIRAAMILRDRLACGADVAEIGEEGALILRRSDQADRGLGDDPEGPFAADEEVAERIAGHVLDALPPGEELRAVVQEAREGHDVVPGDAVLEPPEAASVFGNIPAQRGDILGAGVGWVEEPPAGHGVEQIDRDDAGFDGRGQVLLVDLDDAVHPGEAEDHAALDRRAPARDSRGRAAGGDGEALFAADGQCGLDTFDVHREDGHIGQAAGLRGSVISVHEEVFPFMVDVPGPDLLPEMIDDSFCQHGAHLKRRFFLAGI